MFVSLCHSLFSWNNFYGNPSRQPADVFKNHIKNSFFEALESENGGAIKIDAAIGNRNVLIEGSTFLKCKALVSGGKNGEGGAILIKVNGNCILSKVCSNGCEAGAMSHFGTVCVANTVNSRNEIYQSTFTKMNTKIEITKSIIRHQNGKIYNKEINGTLCKCLEDNFYFAPSQGSTGTTTFSHFEKNENNKARILKYDQRKNENYIKNSNVIENKQNHINEEFNDGVIHAYQTHLTIEKTCIIKNSGKYIIDVNGNEGNLILDGSFIEENTFSMGFIKDTNNKAKPQTKNPQEKLFVNEILLPDCADVQYIDDKDITCYTKELIDLPNERGIFGMALAMLILPKGTKQI